MALPEMYQQLLEEIEEESRQEGLAKGVARGLKEVMIIERRGIVKTILQVRFGEVDAELAAIIEEVIAMSRAEFIPLILQLSREELLARFPK